MTIVKICGLRLPEDAAAVNEAKADLAGVILSRGFRRSISRKEAEKIRQILGPDIRLCGVFVNEAKEYIGSFAESGIIDIIQLHGQENSELIDSLHAMYPAVPVIKAFRVRSEQDLKEAEASHADLVLLDGGTGAGKAFDWELIRDIGRPYILAGGLNEGNVREAVSRFHPYGVDTSSGVETEGFKDRKKILAFVSQARKEE